MDKQNLERKKMTDDLPVIGSFVQFMAGGPTMMVSGLVLESYDYDLGCEVDRITVKWFDKNDVLHEETFRAMELCYAEHPKYSG